tara:strand:+ start:1051 stop:1179 length:129 start_codon:yes stop_codon:yes gene_type:complete
MGGQAGGGQTVEINDVNEMFSPGDEKIQIYPEQCWIPVWLSG